MRTAKTLIRLGDLSSLAAYAILLVFSWGGSFRDNVSFISIKIHAFGTHKTGHKIRLPDRSHSDVCSLEPPCRGNSNDYPQHTFLAHLSRTGHGSSIGSKFPWHSSGPEFDPHVRHILSWRLCHENISTAILLLVDLVVKNFCAILSLSLIQEEQLSVTGERMCTKYW